MNTAQQQSVYAYASYRRVFKVITLLAKISALFKKKSFLCFVCGKNLKI